MAETVGPVLQLIMKGPQDAYLQGSDFSWVHKPLAAFKRHTRFALDIREEPFPNGFVLGSKNVMEIPLSADALGGTTLEIRLPQIPTAAAEDVWVPSVGYALLRRVRVYVNETMIVDQERLWYDLSDKLFLAPARRAAREEMVSAGSLTQPHILHVPLQLPWSQQHFFPLVALPGVRMTLEIDTEAFQNCILLSQEARVDATEGTIKNAVYNLLASTQTVATITLFAQASPVTVSIMNPSKTITLATTTVSAGTTSISLGFQSAVPPEGLVAVCGVSTRRIVAPSPAFPGSVQEVQAVALFDNAILDVTERHQLLRSKMAWTFDTQVDMESKTYKESVSVDGIIDRVYLPSVKVDLSEVNYPVRGLVWVVYEELFGPGTYFQYMPAAMESCQLFCNNQELTLKMPAKHFALATAYTAGGKVSCRTDGIHLHTFSLDLTSPHSNGSLGFNKAKQPYLEATLSSAVIGTQSVVKVFALVRRALVLYKGSVQFITM